MLSQAWDIPLTAPAYQFTSAEIFKKIIKKDASLFSNFKDGKFQTNQHRSAIATANAQDITDVLNYDYSPTHTENIALFNESQKFMCSIFDRVMHTNRGKNHVRENEHAFHAQEIYKKLVTFCTE